MADFEWPWQYSFPPFFTLQPNSDTRSKQMEAWKNLVLSYHKANRIYHMDVTEVQSSKLFFNKDIDRKLSVDAIYQILDELQKQGHLEFVDKSRQRCFIYWRTLHEWGDLIYRWANENGMLNSVCTLFEIVSGDDSAGQEFHGLDQDVLKKALGVLESLGRAELILDEGNEGVKFF